MKRGLGLLLWSLWLPFIRPDDFAGDAEDADGTLPAASIYYLGKTAGELPISSAGILTST